MKRLVLAALLTTALVIGGCCPGNCPDKACSMQTQHKEPQMFSHNVYFTLNDASDEKVDALLADCQTYLKDHPGIAFFAAGKVSDDHDRPVNDRDFDVSLTLVFDSVAAHDTYQVAADHKTFIERNKANWKQVRVFDANCD